MITTSAPAGAPERVEARPSGLSPEAVARDREEDPRGGGGGAERRRERADRGAEVDEVGERLADVVVAQVAERRGRLAEALDPLLVDPEAEALGDHADDVEDARHDDGDEDRARDVAARVVGLLAERRRALEAAEGQEAEDGGDRDGAERDAARRARRPRA